ARSRLPKGESLAYCEECEQEIPLARREAVPGVRLCVRCQQDLENGQQKAFTFNRQGSKGSQMK
ncbi:MAG: TraR/DksA C4-type zinc finger protein, partial [Deltaproteobacteria bacterium]